jgi:ATP-dependent helicase/nuclease subunit A
MSSKTSSVLPAPPDQAQRIAALDPLRSILVQAPAGSGKTDLLTRRFLRLLAEVDDPKQIVAITFTKAAAAEMRHRILGELEKAAARTSPHSATDEWSMEFLAARALHHSEKCTWRLLELSSQLRISTIDSFCRDLAIQQPIHSGIGNNLQINERPSELYRAAARSTLQTLGDPAHPDLSDSIQNLLLWRDNNWKELEDLLVKMLGLRDRWMLDFVLSHQKDWDALRERLERPFANAVRAALNHVEQLLNEVPGAAEEAHQLAQFACEHGAAEFKELAERAEFPCGPCNDSATLEDARAAYLCLARLLLKDDGEFRKQVNVRLGFPKEHRGEKLRLEDLIDQLSDVPGLDKALHDIRTLPPARYSEEDWQIIRASFLLLRRAAAELQAVFAESGTVDFIEVAQIARNVLRGEDNLPTDAAQAVADDIHHLLVDEFQDTSRRQHEFITALIEAWPDPAGRTIFVVGDPMQSIYFFRDAEAELFHRVKDLGFELNDGNSFPLHPVALTANFRTDPALVAPVNAAFEQIFANPDGSGIAFAKAEPARPASAGPSKRFDLHLAFVPQPQGGNSAHPDALRDKQETAARREAAHESQTAEIVALIRTHLDRIQSARASNEKYRVAILGRARTALAPIAAALRDAQIPFRAVELENLRDRPEILDAVALTRAPFNPQDRVAWLGVLRAPWCGLSLTDLHIIAAAEEGARSLVPIPQLLRERLHLLPAQSRKSAKRVLSAFASLADIHTAMPNATPGTLMQQLWRSLGGDVCVDDTARANLDLYWRLLDRLPGGEEDLTGPALDAALEDLCSLPDPATSSDCGVQLMTIHKSKGLEFEVVIVPDLQAPAGRGSVELLVWLERGLAEPGDDGELTEFLIAPVQFKGTNPGAAKKWVGRMRRDREAQEMRRILYVAATRAREELHLFARPSYKTAADDTQTLAEPFNCLLSTAWPALGQDVRTRFEAWINAAQPSAFSGELILPALAAGEDNLLIMPSPVKPTYIRRLPLEYESASALDFNPHSAASITGLGEPEAYQRHEGGLLSRALGNAVHKLLEQLARLRSTLDWNTTRAELAKSLPRILATIRSSGISANQAETIVSTAFEIAIKASHDPTGQWILSPHTDAATESGWAGILSGNLHQVRVDQLFRAGREPLASGDDTLWIIDYKTAHTEVNAPSALATLHAAFAPQLAMYASLLRTLQPANTPIRAGLYYPRIPAFDWWQI